MGLMLSILCALIGFMECQGNFLPEDHITSVRCNIPQLLRKLCLCKMFTVQEKEQDEEKEEKRFEKGEKKKLASASGLPAVDTGKANPRADKAEAKKPPEAAPGSKSGAMAQNASSDEEVRPPSRKTFCGFAN